ncbi:hypothetical protein ACWDUL_01880 [Nocardia niigatensis]
MAEEVIEHDGMLWKPRASTTTTAQQFIQARTLTVTTYKDRFWNPWILEDRAAELEAARTIFAQWTRAEPDFRPRTDAEVDAWLEEDDRRWRVECQRQEEIRLARIPEFDKARYSARLRLLEAQARLQDDVEEHDRLGSHENGAQMPDEKRTVKITEYEQRIDVLRNEITEMLDVVGDPEMVIDESGRLPADRRRTSLIMFGFRRERRVQELRKSVGDTQSRLAVKGLDCSERHRIRQVMNGTQGELNALLAIARPTEPEMCSECATPLAWHGFRSSGYLAHYQGPCCAWPNWAKRLDDARQLLEVAAAAHRSTPPEPPRPKPLAIIPSGLPISEVMERLTQLQAEHPDAEVRRGARNKWEIWPPNNAAH